MKVNSSLWAFNFAAIAIQTKKSGGIKHGPRRKIDHWQRILSETSLDENFHFTRVRTLGRWRSLGRKEGSSGSAASCTLKWKTVQQISFLRLPLRPTAPPDRRTFEGVFSLDFRMFLGSVQRQRYSGEDEIFGRCKQASNAPETRWRVQGK